MVLVAHVALKEGCVFSGSNVSFSVQLMNVPKESVSESGPYYSNLTEVFNDELEVFKPVSELTKSSSDLSTYSTSSSSSSNASGGLFSWFFSSSEAGEDKRKLDVWSVDSMSAQIFGVWIGDSTCLNIPTNSSQTINYNDDLINQHKITDEKLLHLIGKNGKLIFASKPYTVMENQSFSYLEKSLLNVNSLIPNEIPPSFNGTLIRYSYYISVTIQVSDRYNNVYKKTISLPFKVYNPLSSICSITSSYVDSFEFKWNVKNASETPTPKLEDYTHKYMLSAGNNDSSAVSPFYYSFRQIENIVSLNSKTSHYDIADDTQLVCRVSLSSSAFYIGDTISGIFDFTKSEKLCTKVQCKLIYEEKVASKLISDYYKPTESNSEYFQPLKNKNTYSKIARLDRYTLNNITSDFRIIIPPHSPSQFSSDLIKIKWFLKFKFYLIEGDLVDDRIQVISTKDLSEKKDRFKVNSMTWLLPIHVFVPTNFRPLHEKTQHKEQCIVVL